MIHHAQVVSNIPEKKLIAHLGKSKGAVASVTFNDLTGIIDAYTDNANHNCVNVKSPVNYLFGIVSFTVTYQPLVIREGSFTLVLKTSQGYPIYNFDFNPTTLSKNLYSNGAVIVPGGTQLLCLGSTDLPAYVGYYARVKFNYSVFWSQIVD